MTDVHDKFSLFTRIHFEVKTNYLEVKKIQELSFIHPTQDGSVKRIYLSSISCDKIYYIHLYEFLRDAVAIKYTNLIQLNK